MNYKIICDYDKLEAFIKFLPDLEKDECYYVCLFARKKYHSSAQNDKMSLKRFSALSKEWLLIKLKQLEIKENFYVNKNGKPVHQDSLACYITINPRNLKLAQKELIKKLVDKVVDKNNVENINSLALSVLQKSKSKTRFVDFDFDVGDVEHVIKKIKSIFENNSEIPYAFIKSRGGIHVLIDILKVDNTNKTWYNDIKSIKGCDVAGDNLIPIVGCTQGGFTPYFIKENRINAND